MEKVKLGKIRLLLNFIFSLFGRKPIRVRFEVEWEKLPYSFHVDWFKDPSSNREILTTKRVKAPDSV